MTRLLLLAFVFLLLGPSLTAASHIQQIGYRGMDEADQLEATAMTLSPSPTRDALILQADKAEDTFRSILSNYGYAVSNWPEPGVGVQVPATKFNGVGTHARNMTANLDFPQVTVIVAFKGFGSQILRLGNGLALTRWQQNSIALSIPYTARALWYAQLILENRWNLFAFRYDRTTPAIKPVFRRNFGKTTTFSPSPITPQGLAVPWGAGYTIGDGYTGGQSQIQIFSRLLTDAEMDQAAVAPGSVTVGLALWLKNPRDGVDSGPNAYHPTVTGLTEYTEGGPKGLYP